MTIAVDLDVIKQTNKQTNPKPKILGGGGVLLERRNGLSRFYKKDECI